MAVWSPEILSRYLAPDISSFTGATIPDLRLEYPEAPHWLGNHFLNSVLRGSLTGPVRPLVANIIRRAYHGFHYYHEARERTLDYLATSQPRNPAIKKYFEAVASWEAFILQVSMAADSLRGLQNQNVFEKGDGSGLERLYRIGNQIKHLASCALSGQMGEDDTPPLWLDNEGIASFDIRLSYHEASEVLAELANLTDSIQDPRSLLDTSSTPDGG